MPHLIDPKNTIEVLKKYDFTFSKRFGQNFLIDEHVLGKIIRAAEIGPEDYALEIGPGIGTLTEALSGAAKHVYAIEIDDKLIPILEDTLSHCPNVTVIHADALKVDIAALSEEKCGGKPFKVVANLPYYVTTPIVMSLLESHAPVESITIMVQKEVARRMAAKPGTKDYGALSLAVQYRSEPYLVANVPQNSFMPRPDVDSAVIRLRILPRPAVEVADEKLLFDVIRASFNVRRKTLLNGLKNAPELGFSREELEEAVAALGKGEAVRGETLSLEEFGRLTNLLAAIRDRR